METTKDVRALESEQGSSKPLAVKTTWGERVKAMRVAVSFGRNGMMSAN